MYKRVAGSNAFHDVTPIYVQLLVLDERYDDVFLVQEFDLAFLADFSTHRSVFLRSGVSVVKERSVHHLPILCFVISLNRDRIEEGRGELLPENLGVKVGNAHERLSVVLGYNQRLARLVYGYENDFSAHVINKTFEWRVWGIAIDVEFSGSVTEVETALPIAAACECEGLKRENECYREGELHR